MKFFLTFLLLFFGFISYSQINVKAGASFFLGDVGGNSGIGKGFLKDFNFKTDGYEIGVEYEIKHLILGVNHVYLFGADTLVKNNGGGEWWRWIRKFWFKDRVFELTQSYQLNIGKFFLRAGIGEMYYFIKHDTSSYLSNIKEKPYSQFQIIIPIAAGIRFNRISLLFNYRKTFTDYLDNVSLRGNPHNLDAYFTVDMMLHFNRKNKSFSQTGCPKAF